MIISLTNYWYKFTKACLQKNFYMCLKIAISYKIKTNSYKIKSLSIETSSLAFCKIFFPHKSSMFLISWVPNYILFWNFMLLCERNLLAITFIVNIFHDFLIKNKHNLYYISIKYMTKWTFYIGFNYNISNGLNVILLQVKQDQQPSHRI